MPTASNSAAEADALAARSQLGLDPSVADVQNNYWMQRPPEQNAQVIGSGSPLTINPKPLGNGNPIIVGLVDTAVQSMGAAQDGFLLPGVSVVGDVNTDNTTPLHGTAMAETLWEGLIISRSTATRTARQCAFCRWTCTAQAGMRRPPRLMWRASGGNHQGATSSI